MNDNNAFDDQDEGINFLSVGTPANSEEGTNFLNVQSQSDRLSRLEKSKNSKIDRMNSGASLQDSFTDLGDGWLESNSNKMWNDESDQGIQSLYAEVMSKSLTTDAQGRNFYSNGDEYTGSVRRAYLGGTKDTSNNVVKFGLARGDKTNSAARYDPLQGGYATGEKGVDVNNFETDVLLPYGAATMLESVMHGRKRALDGRVVKSLDLNPNAKADYGGGASEYYTNREALFGVATDVDSSLGKKLFDEYMKKLPISHSAFRGRSDYSEVDRNSNEYQETQRKMQEFLKKRGQSQTWKEIEQVTSAVPAALAKGFVDLVDAAQEAVTFLPQLAVRLSTDDSNYDIDLFNDGLKESIIESVDSAVGYNRSLDNQSLERVRKNVEDSGMDITSWDSLENAITDPEKRASLGSAFWEVVTNPSLTVSMVLEIVGSGLGLGAAAKVGSKVMPKVFNALKSSNNKIKIATTKAVETGDTAALKILEKSYTLNKKVADLVRGSVYTNADMAVRMNNDITAFKANNDGNSPDSAKLFEMAVLNRIVSTAEVISLKSLLGKTVTPKEAATKSLIKSAGTVAGKILKGGATEGTQETLDSIVEQVNQKVGASDWEGKTVSEILSESSSDIFTGTLAGIGSGVQISGLSAVAPGVAFGSKALSDSTAGILSKNKTNKSTAAPVISASEEEVKQAKTEYAKLLTRVNNYTAEKGVNENNIGILLDDLDELNTNKYVIDGAPKAKVEAGEGSYNAVVNQLEKFIVDNPGLKLSKRLVRKSIKESVADNNVQKTVDSIPEDTKKAFSAMSKVIGIGEEEDNKTAINNVLKLFKNGTYESVVPESGTIDNELKSLEQSLTGSVSENIEETFDVLQEQLRGKNLKSFSQAEKSSDSTVLGSGPTSNENTDPDFEEVDYDDYTRSLTAERILRTVLGSRETVSNEFKDKAAVFGFTNGIEKSKVTNIIKSYASVEDEAVSGNRGYESRLNKLKGLVESSNPNSKAIDKENREINSMYAGIANSASALERGIKAAKQKAVQMNKFSTSDKKIKQFPTEYKKFNGEMYNINIKYTDGKWVADVKGAENLIKTKNRYTKDIAKGLDDINDRTGVSTNANSGKLVIPVKEYKSKKLRQQDVNYINNISKITSELSPTSNGVSKVILGQKTHDKWNIKGDYYKANVAIINNDTFTADDVVMVDSIEIKTGKDGRYSPVLGDAASKSLKAAIKAGSTIVLDSAMINSLDAIKNPKRASAIAGYIGTKNSGYKVLAGADKYIFINDTAENRKAVKKRQAEFKVEKDSKTLKLKNKDRLVTIKRALDAKLDPLDGNKLSESRVKELTAEFNKLSDTVMDKSFQNDKDKLERFLDREPSALVAEAAKDILNDSESSTPVYTDKVFEQAVKDYILSESSRDETGKTFLSDWSKVAEEGLNKKGRESAVSKLLSELALKAKSLIISTLDEKSFVKGKADLYESLYEVASTKEIYAFPLRKNMTSAEYDALIEGNKNGHVKNSKKTIFLGTRRVVQDLTKLVDISKTTVANSVTLDYLPFTIREAVAEFNTNAKKALMEVEPAELAESTYTRGPDGKPLDGAFNLHNSPARGLFFNKEGKVNEEVLTATYLALGDVIVGDRSAMSRGWKSDYDVAQIFGVQEFEVTNEMQQFAYTHGSLLKTAADSLGKNIMSQLGITKKITEDTSAHEYEALVSDIGNTALLIAEEQKLIVNSTEKSNKMAQMYKGGEQRKIDTNTHFVHISDVPDTTKKYTTNVASKTVNQFTESYEVAVEDMPEASTTRKEPFRSRPDEERLEKAKNVVRNDISGKQIPEDAKETIEILMDTAYLVDVERINEVLNAVDADQSQIKNLLGYVDLKSKEFDSLYYKDKEVQEAKNDAVDKSLSELTLLRDKVVALKKGNIDLYFDYFYSSNDRYMMDSNTVNPQVDKLHRFLVVPKDHKLNYTVKQNEQKGIEFYVEGKEDTENDQSFTVRMALTQAFGQSVDKMNAEDIIAFGNTMLTLNAKQLSTVKKEILKSGKIEIKSDAVVYELEAEHLSHTLQALHFLDGVQSALRSDKKLTSSLSLEFDSLTSGFANKIQQMPILSNMHKHFSRTGVLTREYQTVLKNALNYKGAGVEFDPKTGASVADVLAIKSNEEDGNIEFLDSYKAMAKITIIELKKGIKQKENLTQTLTKNITSGASIFETIKPLLPGGAFLDAGDTAITISSAIRNLFKDPFMIFNYSASIARIIKNLSNNVANDIAKGIATADFSDPELAGVQLVAENLVKSVKIIDPDNDTEVLKTAEDLQYALKNHPFKKLKLKNPLVVEVPSGRNTPVKVANLETMLESVVKSTYGEVIKDVFKESFGPFIETQDAMNDTFKIAFRIFDKKRVDMLKGLLKTKPDRFLSTADHAKVLEDLWDDFPWIVGPLSGADSKKDVISVVTTAVSSPNSIEEARKKPQAVLNASKENKTRAVSPLVKYLEEAVSAGSVLPFHAIDGSEISKTFNSMFKKFQVKAMAAIHDAVIPPLNMSDNAGFEYNKNMAEINTNYVLSDALSDLVERMSKTLNSKEFNKEFKNVTVQGLKTIDDTDNLDFPAAARQIAGSMQARVDAINLERDSWYGEYGLLEGAYYGNLVGTPGGVYRTGYTNELLEKVKATSAPDLSYKKEFKKNKFYKESELIDIVENETETVAPNVAVFTDNATLKAFMVKKLGLDNPTNNEIADAIENVNNVEIVSKLVKTYQNKLDKAAKDITKKKYAKQLSDIIDNISLFTLDEEISSEVTNDTNSSKSDKDASAKVIEKNEGCK
jgi:hypothetical protein